MALTQSQRRVLETAMEIAERGPSLHLHQGPSSGAYYANVRAEEDARRWSQTWIAQAIRDVIANTDGTISAAELLYRHPRITA